MRCARWGTSARVALVWMLALMPPAHAQSAPTEAQGRGPRFLLLSAYGTTRSPVDVARTPILKRRLSLALDGSPLKQALEEISLQSGLRLVYSDNVLPADGRVHLRTDGISVAAALTEVLLNANVDVVFESGMKAALVRQQPRAQLGTIVGRVTDARSGEGLEEALVTVEQTELQASTGADGSYRVPNVAPDTYSVRVRRIGYLSQTRKVVVVADEEVTADLALEKSTQRLDEVVVTGTVVPTAVRALPTPVSVFTAEDLRELGITRVDQLFRGAVPGGIAWENGQGDFFSTVTIRGASSFNNSTIKTYIDGVEVADPSYLATIDPNSIERIEIARGPEGSTIYGANAINGVMQVFTKRGSGDGAGPTVSARAGLGAVQNDARSGAALQQEYGLAVSGSAPAFGYDAGASYARRGDYVPEYGSSTPSVYGGLRLHQKALTIDLSARYAEKSVDMANPPSLVAAGYPFYQVPARQGIFLQQQTYAGQLSLLARPTWKHVLTVGYDRNDQSSFSTGPRLLTPADTLQSVAAVDAGKVSVTYVSTLERRMSNSARLAATVGADHFTVRDNLYFTANATRTEGVLDGDYFVRVLDYRNTGTFAQVRFDFWDALSITGGLRLDWNSTFGSDYGAAASPRVGAAYSSRVGGLDFKLRGSYGEAIRPPQPGQGEASVTGVQQQYANPNLGPEKQRGFDVGLDVFVSDRFSVGITYYHQEAVDLIDNVLADASAQPLAFQFQNAGRVNNRGWELEAGARLLSSLRLRATYSFMSSRIAALAPGYSGDYRIGNQINQVPRHTGGLEATFTPTATTSLGTSAVFMGSWTNPDFVALLGVVYAGHPFRGSLRDYWISYPGFTKVNLNVSQQLTSLLRGYLRVENVGNAQTHEVTNAFIPVGRVTVLGAELKF